MVVPIANTNNSFWVRVRRPVWSIVKGLRFKTNDITHRQNGHPYLHLETKDFLNIRRIRQ